MDALAWVAVIAVVLILLDRLAVWAESRGWVTWRRRRGGLGGDPGGGLGGAAAGPLVELFHPSYRHVVDERERQRAELRRSGRDEPLRPGPSDLPEA